jgi:hypothetical protein
MQDRCVSKNVERHFLCEMASVDFLILTQIQAAVAVSTLTVLVCYGTHLADVTVEWLELLFPIRKFLASILCGPQLGYPDIGI